MGKVKSDVKLIDNIIHKFCTECNEYKLPNNFYKSSNIYAVMGLASKCKNCFEKKYHANRDLKEYAKSYHRKTKYNLTQEEYNILLEKQEGKCAICSRTERNFHLDHNHETGKIRAFLCVNCNAGIGMFNEDIETLKKVIEYLIKYGK